MKITELKPSYATGNGKRFLIIECPHCRKHEIGIQISGDGQFVWEAIGDLEHLTLKPSVLHIQGAEAYRNQQFIYGQEMLKTDGGKDLWHCDFHFFVRDGEIIFV